MKENKKRVFFLLYETFMIVAVLLTVLFIFSNSMANAEESSKVSLVVTETLENLLSDATAFFTNGKVDHVDLNHNLVRKAAHFSEYALLGFLSVGALIGLVRKYRHLLFAELFGALIAVLDETLQTFVEGRAGLFTDCLIDLAGFTFGGFLFFVLALIVKNAIKKRGEKSLTATDKM